MQLTMWRRGRGIFQFMQTLCLISYCCADMCNWRGSGLSLSGSVQQVRLRCAEGSVTWLSPVNALRVLLEPNVWSVRMAAACIRVSRASSRAAVHVERAGVLEPLLLPGDGVRCFGASGARRIAVFVQAEPNHDSEASSVRFTYELLLPKEKNRVHQVDTAAAAAAAANYNTAAVCRPCSDEEILQTVCSSDFVIRGSIRNVSHHPDRQASVIEVGEGRLYRQRSDVFERDPHHPERWHGRILVPLQCHVKAGPGLFLFTGAEHFGETWLTCAPRLTVFQNLHRSALSAKQIHCDFPLD